jgi:hypothetical protein
MGSVNEVGNLVDRCRIELQCCPYRRGLAEQFRSGGLDAKAQFRIQRVIARQGEDMGALSVGDPLYDGPLTDIMRAGTRIEKGTRRTTHPGSHRFRSSAMVRGTSLGVDRNGIPFVLLMYDVPWRSGYGRPHLISDAQNRGAYIRCTNF